MEKRYKFNSDEKEIVKLIKKSCTPDLLHPNTRRFFGKNFHNGWQGHCYHACEVIWLLFAKYKGFQPCTTPYDGINHWWLINVETNEFIDTEPQHDYGCEYKVRKFLKTPPSKRAKIILDRISDSL